MCGAHDRNSDTQQLDHTPHGEPHSMNIWATKTGLDGEPGRDAELGEKGKGYGSGRNRRRESGCVKIYNFSANKTYGKITVYKTLSQLRHCWCLATDNLVA